MNRSKSQPSTVLQPSDEGTLILEGNLPPRASGLWLIGAHIEGRYKIIDIRGGSGISGMGVVFIVEDGVKVFAAKTFQRRFARNLSFIERFIREAETWILTGFHPNIVHAYWLDIIDAVPFLFLECVPRDEFGRISLADWIHEGPLPLDLALDFGMQVCEGMNHATQAVAGLVHRDLKPENLLIGPDHIVKITDFGLVRCRVAGEIMLKQALDYTVALPQETGITQAGAVFGTPSYMAPEQFSDPAGVSGAADIYAFGCCLYEMLAGRPPFLATTRTTARRLQEFRRLHEEAEPRPLEALAPECPPALEATILRCLAKDPADRWESFSAVRDALAEIQAQTLKGPQKRLAQVDLEPRAVAQQMQSLNLLEGYRRAVRLRNLRDNQESSPYAFHLAMASYFHCAGNHEEERRQLEKAARVRGLEPGDEVTRRLGTLLLREGHLSEADRVFAAFLQETPGNLDGILFPYVRLLLLRKRFGAVEKILQKTGEDDLRTHYLRACLMKAQDDPETAAAFRILLDLLLDRVVEKLKRIEAEDRPGWDRPGDPDRLRSVFARLRPDQEMGKLATATHSYWPDLTGYPDFSPDMAWLSNILGELAALPSIPGDSAHGAYLELASLLDHPHRIEIQQEREEYWFWMQAGEVALDSVE